MNKLIMEWGTEDGIYWIRASINGETFANSVKLEGNVEELKQALRRSAFELVKKKMSDDRAHQTT